MIRSQRGAIRVGIVWMVVTLVLFFIALFMAYSASDAAAKSKQEAEKAKSDLAEGEKRWQDRNKVVAELSNTLGWTDPNTPGSATNMETMKAEFEGIKTAFEAPGDAKDVRSLLNFAKAQYAARATTIQGKDDELADVKRKASQTESGLQASLADKDKQIESLRRQLSDQTDAATSKQKEFESTIANLRSQGSQYDADLRKAKADGEAADRKHAEEVKALETRLGVQGQKLRFLKEPEAADGAFLAVSKDLGLGYIDIGANQRLSRGTRFTIVSGKAGSKNVKALCEVTNVEPTRAEVKIFDVRDQYDPVVPGDTIYNPMYDPKGQRYAVLAGRFSGKYNEKELKDLLAQMGIKVQAALDNDTDYLILGGESYTDSTGAPVETPIQPTELAVYKEAEAKGVQIMALKDLRTYFSF